MAEQVKPKDDGYSKYFKKDSDIQIRVEGFKSAKQAKAWARWYSYRGEQDWTEYTENDRTLKDEKLISGLTDNIEVKGNIVTITLR